MTIKHFAAFAASATLLAAVATAHDGGRKVQATLGGAAEVPGPGDTDGSGTATVTVNSGQNRVCYTIAVSKIDAATMAHIHLGAVGVAGPVKVTLKAPGTTGKSSGCVTVDRSLAIDILKNPDAFYVNVHTAALSKGAIRGQLTK